MGHGYSELIMDKTGSPSDDMCYVGYSLIDRILDYKILSNTNQSTQTSIEIDVTNSFIWDSVSSKDKLFPSYWLKLSHFRHNEDGSYTYGYESADGTFKIETKLPTGDVKGKYGYVDDTGKVRVVEYGATKYGFDPSGEG